MSADTKRLRVIAGGQTHPTWRDAIAEAADLIDLLLDPESKLFLRQYAEQVERLEAELAAARNNGQFGLELLRAVDLNVRLRSEIEQFQELVRRLTRQRNAACIVAERYVVDLPAELRQIYHRDADAPDLVALLATDPTATITCTVCDATLPADGWAFHVHHQPDVECGFAPNDIACTMPIGHNGPHESWAFPKDES